MTPCLDEETIFALGRRDVPADVRRRADEHIAECDECRLLVATFVRSSSAMPRAQLSAAMAPTTPVHGGQTSASTPISAPVRPGDILAGKYVVERVLGAGGMGVVVAARHLQLGQRFALKFLLPAACEAPDAVARFLREGRAAARITSEHVARVVDTGVLDTGAPYLVMEYLDGSDLGALGKTLSAEDAVEYVLQACEAIVEAHALGIVHRDLKPANLFLARRKDGSPLVKVLDFGISKADSGSSPQLTSTSALMGSPRYMSPEQMISAKDVDARTDVWALGVILFELVAGQPVWNADTVQGLCAMIQATPAPALRSIVPAAPPLLDDVIARCLAKSPDQRVPSVADLAMLLAPLASASAQTSIDRILRVAGRSRGSVPIPRPPPAVATGAASPVASVPSSSRTISVASPPAPASGGRVVLALGAMIVLVGAGAGGALLLRRPPEPIAPVAPAASVPIAIATPSASAAVSAAPEPAAPAASSVAVKPAAKPLAPRHKPSGTPPAPGPASASEPDRAYTDRK